MQKKKKEKKNWQMNRAIRTMCALLLKFSHLSYFTVRICSFVALKTQQNSNRMFAYIEPFIRQLSSGFKFRNDVQRHRKSSSSVLSQLVLHQLFLDLLQAKNTLTQLWCTDTADEDPA